MKRAVSFLCAVTMIFGMFQMVRAEEKSVEIGGVPYVITGENLFSYPNFADGDVRKTGDEWYVGVNTSTKWDGKIPNLNTGENLKKLSEVTAGTGESNRGTSFYYAADGGNGERSKYYLCENNSSANGSFWNGQNSLLGYVPIEKNKTYYFSYWQSAWGGSLKASVRYGAINSGNYCDDAAAGSIKWSGTGGVDAKQYDGDNVEKTDWVKHEAIITAEDADYFFFNLYWLQALDYVCITGFELCEAEALDIYEIKDIKVDCYAGSSLNLPESVQVTYTNGMTGTRKVVWNTEGIDLNKDGIYNITGEVGTYAVNAVVKVYSDSSDENYTITKRLQNNDGELRAKIMVNTEKKGKLTAVMALYDGENKVVRVSRKVFEPTEESDIAFTMPSPIEDGCSVKIMVWDDKMRPLADCKSEMAEVNEGGSFVAVNNVRLLDGMFKDAQELNLNYLLNIDVDRLLAPSFEMAGLDAPNGAVRYGGWERKGANNWSAGSPDTFTLAGHSLGHWMSGAAETYAATGNSEIKERLDYAVDKLAEIQEKTGSGYIGGVKEDCFKALFGGNSSSWASGYWVPWYGVHKIYQGLLDTYRETGSDKALAVAIKFADWAVEGTDKLTDAQMQEMLNVEYGGMNEVFANLYGITGDEKYLRAAVRFTHDSILNPLAEGRDNLTGLHANTQIPKIIGAAAIYDENEERTDYMDASKFFWDTVVNKRSFVIGGNSVSEHFEALGAESLTKKTCESCNAYNMIKLTEHLFRWDHDSKYMDFVENVLYNDILGAQDPTTGNKMYFTSLLQGHFRVYGDSENAWWCCTGTGMENPGRYAKCIYYKDKDEFYVNLYIPSEAVWNETGLKLKMDTKLPYSDKVTLSIEEGSADAALKFRVPSWLNGEMTVKVNGEDAGALAENGYMTVRKEWNSGDVIEITLPMGLSLYTARDNENKVAFRYGPVVLAAPLGSEGLPEDTRTSETDIPDTTVSVPSLSTESREPSDFIEVVDLSSLKFRIDKSRTSSGQEITLMPFYGIHHQFHNVYWFLNSEADPYEKALNAITEDSVTPDGQQDEIGHNLKSVGSHNGSFTSGIATYYWRDAYGKDAYFSYDMKVSDYLYVSYWGDDGPFDKGGVHYERKFDIYADGVKIGEEEVNKNNPGKPYNAFYQIPESVTKGKEKITIKFVPKSGNYCAGGIIDLRTVREGKITVE